MDVSASTSFESSPDKRSSTYVGDNTLYDSALDHQLSTTAYKTCNGKQRTQFKVEKQNRIPKTEEHLDHIFQGDHSPATESYETDGLEEQLQQEFHLTDERDSLEQMFQFIPTLPKDRETYILCKRWLDTLKHTHKLEKHTVYRLLRKMEYQLTINGRLSAPFSDTANLEDLLEESSNEPSSEKTSDSGAFYLQKDLKEEHFHLERKINGLKLKIAALQIQTHHQQQKLRKLNLQNSHKSSFSRSIKKTLMGAARRSLQSQARETFPNHLISQIFEVFAGDEKLKEHFKTMDYELRKIVHKMCLHAYEQQKPAIEASVNEKVKSLKQKLIQKYENQLSKQEESQQKNALAMKQKCFNMLKQVLLTDCPDQCCGEEYLKQLEVLYEQEILKE